MEEERRYKDLPMGPKKIRSTVLSEAEEESIVAFRKMTEYLWMMYCIAYKKRFHI